MSFKIQHFKISTVIFSLQYIFKAVQFCLNPERWRSADTKIGSLEPQQVQKDPVNQENYHLPVVFVLGNSRALKSLLTLPMPINFIFGNREMGPCFSHIGNLRVGRPVYKTLRNAKNRLSAVVKYIQYPRSIFERKQGDAPVDLIELPRAPTPSHRIPRGGGAKRVIFGAQTLKIKNGKKGTIIKYFIAYCNKKKLNKNMFFFLQQPPLQLLEEKGGRYPIRGLIL